MGRIIAAIVLGVLSVVGPARTLQAADVRIVEVEARDDDQLNNNGSDNNIIDNTGSMVCNLSLKGPIENGDLQKIQTVYQLLQIRLALRLCLDSEGGSYLEALNIAEFLMQNAIGTGLPRDAVCVSSCAVIFMAGSGPQSSPLNRFMHPSATLAFHAPYMDLEGMGDMPVNTRWAKLAEFYNDGVVAIRRLAELTVEESRFPPELLVEMLKKGPKEAYVIDTIGKIIQYRIGVFDVVVPRFRTPAFCNVCANKFGQDPCDLDEKLDTEGGVPQRVPLGYRLKFEKAPRDNTCVIDVEQVGQTIKGWFLRPEMDLVDVLRPRGDFGSKSRRSKAEQLPYWYLYPPSTLLSAIAPP